MNKASNTKQSAQLLRQRLNCIFMALILTLSFNFQPVFAQSDNPHQVNANRVTLRQGPGTQHEVITRLNKGQLVSKIVEQGQWSQVSYQQTTGWMASRFLKPVTATPPSSPSEPGADQASKPGDGNQTPAEQASNQTKPKPEGVAHTVSANGVTVRRGPSTRYINFAYLNKNHKVTVIGQTESWSHIEFKAPDDSTPSQGWLASRFLKKDEPVASDPAAMDPTPAINNPETTNTATAGTRSNQIETTTLKTEQMKADLTATNTEAVTREKPANNQAESNKIGDQQSQQINRQQVITQQPPNIEALPPLKPQASTDLSTAAFTKQSSAVIVEGPFETVANNNPGIDLSLKNEQLSCDKDRQGKVKRCLLRMNFELKTEQTIAYVKVRCGAQLSIGISNGNPIKHNLQQEVAVKIQDQPHYTINASYSPKGNYTVNAVDLLSHRCAAIAYQLEKS